MTKKKKTFKVGDRIGRVFTEEKDWYGSPTSRVEKIVYNEDVDPDYGLITDILSNGKVMVKWDNEYLNKEEQKAVDPEHLDLEENVQKLYSKLEVEFNMVEKQVKEKLREASKLILDAQKLAKKTGHKVAEMYDAVSPLENAMDAAGWRTSSWNC